MVVQLRASHELFSANMTDKRLDAEVDLFMFAGGTQLEEALVTDGASKRTFTGMATSMCRQIGTGDEALTADVADEWTLVGVVQALVTAQVGRVSELLTARPTRRCRRPRSSIDMDSLVLFESGGSGAAM